MEQQQRFEAPAGPPPGYPMQPPQAHYDAGSVAQDPRGAEGYYGSPAPYGGPQGPYQQQPPMNYGQPGYPPQGYPPQGYPQQGYPPQGYPPQGGYYQDPRAGQAGADGCCAGIMAALACCCCLDILF